MLICLNISIVKRIVLFFVASLLLISESATIYTSEKQEV